MAGAERTLTLRPPAPGDAKALAGWLAGALAVALADAAKAEAMASSVLDRVGAGDDTLRIIGTGGEAAGVVSIERAGDEARFPLVAVNPARRGRGLAAQALLAIEDALDPPPARLLAPVSPGDGRALYFWLRLGYRPVVLSESGGRQVWMERRTAS